MPLRDNLLIDRMLVSAPHPRPTLREARESGDAVLRRAAFLLPEDRALIELAIRNAASHRALGRVLNRPAGTITRRLRRILARLHNPIVITLLEPHNPLPPHLRQLGVEHLLQGQSVRRLAERHQMPARQVRAMLDEIRGWHRARTTPTAWERV